MNFYFAFDEYTDVANKIEATKIANDVMAAFRNREANIQLPHGKITTMAQQWVNLLQKVMWDGLLTVGYDIDFFNGLLVWSERIFLP